MLKFTRFNILFQKSLWILAVLICFSSCSKKTKKHSQQATVNDSLIPPVVIQIANLPDSNKPKEILLAQFPKPQVFAAKPLSIQSFVNAVTHEPIPPEAQGLGFFTNIASGQGLPQETVNDILIDSKGNLWLGTGAGACRYDGKNMAVFTMEHGLPGNSISTMIEDRNGNFWLGTVASGLSRYDGKTFTNYSISNGLPSNSITDVFEDKKGGIWTATIGGGISCYDGKGFKNYTTADGLANNYAYYITEDRKGNIWVGTNGGGVSCFDGNKFTNYTTEQGLVNNNVFHIMEDRSGQLWFSTIGGGASRFDGTTFTNYTTVQGLASNIVLSTIEDQAGNLWFCTAGGGVSKFDGKLFVNFKKENGLANDLAIRSIRDKAGNLWFGTGGGASCYKGKSFTNFLDTDGRLLNGIFGMLKDNKGNLWVGSADGGLSCYDGKRFINYTTGFMHAAIYDIFEDSKGDLWLGTDRGLCHYDGKIFSNYTSEQGLGISGEIFKITPDNDGNLWLATFGSGAICFNGKTLTHYTTNEGLVNNLVRTITKDRKGNLWFGTGGGLSKFDGKSFTNYTRKQGLANDFVIDVTEDKKGNLWIGTEGGGLSRFDGKSFLHFTSSNGLPDNVVTSVFIDSISNIVVGTNFGFGLLHAFNSNRQDNRSENTVPPQNDLSNEELENFTPEIEIFNVSKGYPARDINYGQNAMLRDEKGILWAATGSDMTGLVRFDQSALRKTSLAPLVVLQKVKINNENICWNNLLELTSDSNRVAPNIPEEASIMGRVLSDAERDSMRMEFGGIKFDSIARFYPIPINLVLPYRHNNISFDFAAIEIVRPSLVKYQYYLDGYDKDWNPVTQQSSASYGNMKEGSYTFKLRAQSPEGIWSEPHLYKFRVLPPWWRTWWAYAWMVLIGVSAIWLFVRWRINAVRKEKMLLEEKVELRTRELKSTQQELIQREKMASLGELTAGIAHEIQNPLNFVNNFSEVNKELIAELREEMKAGNSHEIHDIFKNIEDNEEKIMYHGKRADAIVKNMLQHSRASTGKKEPTDINALADEYLRLSYHGLRAKDKTFNANFEMRLDPAVGKLEIVPQEVGRVLLNLFNNAFYAAMEKKRNSADSNFNPTVRIETKRENGKIIIIVNDNGNGIPQNILDKIFQPFFTTKPAGDGTGLGLSLAYDTIVNGHGGDIQVKTQAGEGSSFLIILPLDRQEKKI